MAVHKIENESLEAHVSICEERYNHLCDRIGNVESELNNLEKAILQLSNKIDNYIELQNAKFDTIYKGAIVALVAAVGFFAANFFLNL